MDSVSSLITRENSSRRGLLSVAGKLAHAGRCLPPGRGFTRRGLDAAGSVTHLQHRVRLTAAVRADLRWWHTFLPLWNGTFPLVPPRAQVTADSQLSTDSSRRGAGAYHEGRWWSLLWPDEIAQDPAPSMMYLEMIPVLLSCVMWGHLWSGKRVQVFSDNMGVVGSWGRGWAREPRTMAIIRHLLFLSATRGFILDVQYISTKC